VGGEPLQLYREIEAEISSSVKQAMKSDAAKPSVTRIRKCSPLRKKAQFLVAVVSLTHDPLPHSLPLAATPSNRLRSVVVPA
jgi:hypothetical protein